MNTLFADTIKNLRMKKGFSQSQLANLMFVNKATISKWESGTRLPDAAMITRLAREDSEPILAYSLLILEEVVPNAMITGFNWPQETIEYAKSNRVDLAFLDIELGKASGLDLCRKLLAINPCTKVVYLTAYPDYSLNAWDTDACGFMVKPLTQEGVRRQLKKLHYPFTVGGADA